MKGFKLVVSSSPQIAMAVGAYGVHFSRKIKNIRIYKRLSYSCSFHGFSDIRRAKKFESK